MFFKTVLTRCTLMASKCVSLPRPPSGSTQQIDPHSATGSCYCVGWVGGTLGGGVGRLSGLHGMMIDSLRSVNIMLPNTTVVEASEDSNPELFWGLRGAGFNYGIVLNATYQVYDQVPQGLHMNADFKFPLTQAQSYYANLTELAKNQPPELAVITYFNWDNTTNQVVPPQAVIERTTPR